MIKKTFPWLGFFIILVLGLGLSTQFKDRKITDGMDVYYSWIEGKRLVEGNNPYSRIHTGNMQENKKYATYFPAFYELSAFSQAIGLDDLDSWTSFWRTVFIVFHLAITLLIYYVYGKHGHEALGLFFALLWQFYRWPLYDLFVANFEALPIFFLLLSLLYLDKKPRLSLISYSASLALKQIGIFLFPLYLIWILKKSKGDYLKNLLLASSLIASVPLISSLPFIIWDFSGFVKSILFSVTRTASSHLAAPSVDMLFGLEGIWTRLPMLLFFGTFYYLASRYDLGKFTAGLIIFTIFIGYNPVLFQQYLSWMTVFVPFIIYDLIEKKYLHKQK